MFLGDLECVRPVKCTLPVRTVVHVSRSTIVELLNDGKTTTERSTDRSLPARGDKVGGQRRGESLRSRYALTDGCSTCHQQGVTTSETSLGALACGRQGDQHDGADGQDELGSRCRSWSLGRPGEREERWGSRSVFDWRVLEYNPTLRLGR